MSNPKDLVGAKKAPMDLVPAAGAIMSAPAHQNGADKYGPFNWRLNPVQMMTYLAAMRRHMDALIDGQDVAEDTGIHHLSHIIAGANILADAMGLGNLIDNRPPKGPAADMLRAQDKSTKTGWFNCGDPECGSCPRPAEDDHHRKMEMNRKAGIAMQRDVAASVSAELAVCEDTGNHVQGRHLLSCPDFS